jgi:peptidoglycan/LPS O-acetylase OafA/YrhL
MGLLRILLALSVMTGHADHSIFGFRGVPGNIAVQCFFIISGFYMALVLNEKYVGATTYFTFIQQRFLRIYPTYFAVVLFFLLFELVVSHWFPCGTLETWYEHGNILSSIQIGLLATMNLLIFGQDYSTFFSLDPSNSTAHFLSSDPNLIPVWPFILDPPTWSVAVELTFYLAAPLLVRRSLAFQSVLFLIILTARIWIFLAVPNSRPWLYYFAPLQFAFFIAGSLGYIFYKKYKSKLILKAGAKPWIVWLFCGVVILYNRLPLAHHLYLFFIVLTAVMVPILFAATRNSSTDRMIGELSYPFYLVHYHIILI